MNSYYAFLSNVVIIDEAGVDNESETLMAIHHNLSLAYLFNILGDHKQLPPTVLSLHAKLVADNDTSPPFTIIFRTIILTGKVTNISVMHIPQYLHNAGNDTRWETWSTLEVNEHAKIGDDNFAGMVRPTYNLRANATTDAPVPLLLLESFDDKVHGYSKDTWLQLAGA